jgi:hypothetical protein
LQDSLLHSQPTPQFLQAHTSLLLLLLPLVL